MSKRSYRRLAVVAGTALALGSTAPAMAIRVNAGAQGNGNANVGASIETINVSETLENVQTNVALPTGLAVDAVSRVNAVADRATPILVNHIFGLLDNVECVTEVGITAAAGLNLRAVGTVGVGPGRISGNLQGLATAPVALTTDAAQCLAGVQADVLTTVDLGQRLVGAVGGIATGTAADAVAYAHTLPGAATGIVTPILSNLLTVNANANANASANAVFSGVASLF